MSIFHRDTCRLCGGRNLEVVLPLTPTPLADAYVPSKDTAQEIYPLDLYLCGDCGHVQLLDVVQAGAIYRDYIYETKSSLGLVDHFRDYAQEVVEQFKVPKGSFVVDIGSNDGSLLRCFQERGMRVLGIDPAVAIARDATEAGIETWPEFFDLGLARKIKAGKGAATVITSNNLVANVDDLDGFFDAVRELLAPDGVFLFESFYLVDFVKNMVFDFAYHEHLSYFSITPLLEFCRKHGLRMTDAKHIPTKGGSLRYMIQHAAAKQSSSPSLTEMVKEEEAMGTRRPETFQAFSAAIEKAKAALLSELKGLVADGKTIAGYGASATTTTLVYHFGLGELLSFIVDDYPAKQNLFSPGHHIPILPSTELYSQKPDCVVIIAWRYWEPIIEKHRKYLEQGGHFIVPLPSLQIL
jgi:SAM-dependent methyltransferase